MNEAKKGFRAKKHRVAAIEPSKPRNFVAKNAKMGGAGAHEPAKYTRKTKHKAADVYAESLNIALSQRLDELKDTTKQSYKEKAQAQVKELEPHAKKGEYKDIAQRAIDRRKKGLNRVGEEIDSPEYNDEAGMSHNSLHTIARATSGLLDTIKDGDNLPEWCQEKLSIAEDYLVTVWDYLQSEQGIEEKLNLKTMDTGAVIKDFEKSNAPQFRGKTKAKRRQMAIAAKMGAMKKGKRKTNESGRGDWDPNASDYRGDYGGSANWGRRDREDDEYHVPDPVEPQYNIKVNGQVINQFPFANRAEALAWAKQEVAAGKLDPKTAMLSPIREDVTEGGDELDQYSLDQLQSYYSDFNKDLLGFRPRGASEDEWNDPEWLKAQINKLHDYFDRLKSTPDGRAQLKADGWRIDEGRANTASARAGLAKRKSTKPLSPEEQAAKDKAKSDKWLEKQRAKVKAKEGWTTDTLAAQLFEQELTYEDKLNSLLAKKLSK